MKRWLAILLVSSLMSIPNVGAQAGEWNNCGDVDLIFRNPDLNPAADGFIHASGSLFAQFQAIGGAADQIETFGFSFGAYSPGTGDIDESACDQPVWFTGPYVLNYRADTDPTDGFFINLQTALVPDGQYIAAVHAYDGSDNEMARFWSRAVVDNCDGDVGSRCTDDSAQHARQDRIVPWPIILPGDGALPSGKTGMTIEFAEDLSDLQVYLNGEDITASLDDWEGRTWDNDLIPGYGPNGLGNILVPECSQQPPQSCSHLGEAYQWTARDLTADDVIRVVATDRAGNVATKDIHLGSTTAGGAITQDAALVTMTANEVSKTISPGAGAEFPVTITNTGGGQGHINPFAEGPEGWVVEWEKPHYVVDSGKSLNTYVIVDPPRSAAPGTYDINASLEYIGEGGAVKKLGQALKVTIDAVGGTGPAQASGDGPQGDDNNIAEADAADTPGLPVVALLAAVAIAFVAARRRPQA